MGDISDHFSREEFACNDHCGFNTADVELIKVLEGLRKYFGKPVYITSGCRCLRYNTRIGGASKSLHMWGQAADIRVSGVSPWRVATYLEATYNGLYGIGRYITFTHIDIRSKGPARWGHN